MKTMQKFVEQLLGDGFKESLVELLHGQMVDFQEDHRRYLEAVRQLREELGDGAVPGVDAVVSAIDKRTSSDLLFAGFLGLKMNWDHFMDPMTPNCTWRQVDFEDYLQEHIARALPAYQETEAVLADFYASLSEPQRQTYSAIAEYEASLQTMGPKLAHYYGYLLGNSLFGRIVPGYCPDAVLTLKYNTMLEKYFGKRFLPINL